MARKLKKIKRKGKKKGVHLKRKKKGPNQGREIAQNFINLSFLFVFCFVPYSMMYSHLDNYYSPYNENQVMDPMVIFVSMASRDPFGQMLSNHIHCKKNLLFLLLLLRRRWGRCLLGLLRFFFVCL